MDRECGALLPTGEKDRNVREGRGRREKAEGRDWVGVEVTGRTPAWAPGPSAVPVFA